MVQTAEDKIWQAESDARTLASAAEIAKNKSRMNKAIAAANNLAKQAEQTKNNVKKFAKTARKPAKKIVKKVSKKTRRKK